MITFPHKILNPFVNIDWHGGLFMTGPIPVPGMAFHIGAGCFITARFLGDNKENDRTIFADQLELVSRKHCPQRLIPPHWNLYPFTPPQWNIRIPLLILFSESKCQFASLSVNGPDGPIAVSVFKWIGFNQACAEPCSMPTSTVANWGTVEIGFTFADFLAGLLSIAFDALFSFILGKIIGFISKLLPRGLFKSQMLNLLKKLNIPLIFRGEGGMFDSMAEELIQDLFGATLSDLIGMAWSGSFGSDEKQKPADVIQQFIDTTSENLSDWMTQDDRVRDKIDKLSDDEVKKLSNDEKIDCLDKLRGGYMSEADKEAQRKIYRNWPLDKDFVNYDNQKRNEFNNKLKNDKIVQDAQDNWDTLTNEQKKEAMQQVVNLQSETYGFSKTPAIELYNEAPKDGMISNGYYVNNKIHLNTDSNSKFGSSFEKAVNVVTHENAHHYQHELSEQFNKGKIPKSDPTYEQSKIFASNTASKGYVTPNEDFKTYKVQPIENHSNRTGILSQSEMATHKILKLVKSP